MKNTILISAFVIFGIITLKAQHLSFSCIHREYCTWSEITKTFDNCEGYDENSLFVVNKAETMFTHTIESMKSTYYVTSRERDKEKDIWCYYVISDVGNKYFFIIDPKNKQIKAVSVKDVGSILTTYTVKAIF